MTIGATKTQALGIYRLFVDRLAVAVSWRVAPQLARPEPRG
jgi:hypothetical protein